MKICFFSICAKNYIPYARTLFQSLREHHDDIDFRLILGDRIDGAFDPEKEEFPVVEAESIGMEYLDELAFRYDVAEFNAAIKPACFDFLFRENRCDAAVYIDPDIYFLDRMKEVEALLCGGAEAILTPHICSPDGQDGQRLDDLSILRYGTYNLGFLALADSSDGRRLLEWWKRKTRFDCREDLGNGLFMEQKWMDLVPSFVERTDILRHPGYNVAYWNLMSRTVRKTPDGWRANEAPLIFVHFSGIRADKTDKDTFSIHRKQFRADNMGDMAEILRRYRGALDGNGLADFSRLSYAYDTSRRGHAISPIVRRLYREDVEAVEGAQEDAWDSAVRHCASPAPEIVQDGRSPISRLMYRVWSDRSDLRSAFDLSSADSREAFFEWYALRGYRELGLDPIFAEREATLVHARKREAGLEADLAAARKREADLRAMLDAPVRDREARLEEASDRQARLEEALAAAREREVEQERRLADMASSRSWKITLPLREARRWATRPGWQARRYATKAVPYARRLYRRLPLSRKTRRANRVFLARHAPWVLRAGGVSHVSASPPALPATAPSPSGIRLSVASRPVVSVVIPVHGHIDYTLRCLASIAAHSPSVPFETIMIDDCSPDNSVEVLRSIEGVRLIANPENQGFIRACNRAAKAARGDYLCFLNNDTVVRAGWLDELVGTFHELPGTGLVGSKLLYPDNTLQEAGGIVWRDGSAWAFGHGQDPSLPEYNYAREVDYCCGASIMVPTRLFEELGGFDELYCPAYCEDSDMALKIRDRGRRVIYQPLSVVVHYEGVTSGRDVDRKDTVKHYQIPNTEKLRERWKDRLAHHRKVGEDVDGAKDRAAKHRVLVLDTCTPTPDRDAGSVTTLNTLFLLREMGFQVTFIPVGNYLFMPDYTVPLQRAGIEMLYHPYCISVERHLQKAGGRYDLVLLFRADSVEHLDAVRKHCPQARTIFHPVDLQYLRLSREADILEDGKSGNAVCEMKEIEMTGVRATDATLVHSTVEADLLHREAPDARVRLSSLVLDVPGSDAAFEGRRDLVFMGNFHHVPNVDGVRYFAGDVMPGLRRRLPGVRIHIVGGAFPENEPPADVRNLASDDVIVAGYVEDLEPVLDRARVFVAPLRYGAGVKGKVGTAMSHGLPVVATSMAVEGMELTDGENVLVADGADAFADAVARLYNDGELWTRLSRNGVEFARRSWGADAMWATLAGVLNDIGFSLGAERRDDRPLTLYAPRTGRYAKQDGGEGGSLQDTYAREPGAGQKMAPATAPRGVDGTSLHGEAVAFMAHLNRIKLRIDKNFPWYPHDTLANFVYLEKFFTRYPLERLVKDKHVADIGAADGDLSFFLQSLGYKCDIIDHATSNMNNLEGARKLLDWFEAHDRVRIFDIDLDSQFGLPEEKYDLVFFLGILYHLKNPFYVLEKLSSHCNYLVLSTRVAQYTPDGTKIEGNALAYLLNEFESNNDPTNFWIFTNPGLKRLFERTGWDIVYQDNVGDTTCSNPSDNDRDERSFVLLKNRNELPTEHFALPQAPASVAADLQKGDYRERLSQELRNFENVDHEELYDLPPIMVYWSNKYLLPRYEEFGFSTSIDLYIQHLRSQCRDSGGRPCRFISLGSGNCGVEIDLAVGLLEADIDAFRIDCLEINPAMLERGRESAKERGVEDKLSFVEADFNAWAPDGKYDAVIANQVLHHVMNLEGLFSAIGGALRDDGVFLTNDMIGRNGHKRWPETLDHVNRYWDRLPDSYKYDHTLQRTYDAYPDFDLSPGYLPGIDPNFEGVRSQDVLPLLVDRFDFELFLAHGGILDLFIDHSWGPNFDVDRPEDLAFVDEVTELQDRLLQSGEIKPTQMVAVMRKRWPHPPKVWGRLTPKYSVRDPRWNVDYLKRIAQEFRMFENVEEVHKLPPIFIYWNDKYLLPRYKEFGFSTSTDLYVQHLRSQCRDSGGRPCRFVSLGSGNCDVEIGLAVELSRADIDAFRIDCLEINPAMLERGRTLAKERGVEDKLSFVEADFNAWTPDGEYDAVIANQVLHHVVNLEGLFSAIGGALRDDGVFLTNDMIGRNGHKRWPETLDHVNRYWDRLPDSYKYDHALQRTYDAYPDFDLSSGYLPGIEPSFEGVRSQDVLPLLVDRFDFELFLAHGGILDLFIDRSWGPNFDVDRPEDLAFVDEVAELQDRLLQSGEIKPTQMVAVMRKRWPHPPKVWGRLTPKYSVRDPDREADYQERLAGELRMFENDEEVHNFPPIMNYWNDKYLLPRYKEFGFSTSTDLYVQHLRSQCRDSGGRPCRFVSLGSGNCDVEIGLAVELSRADIDAFRIDCLEINPAMLERGRTLAKKRGVEDKLSFVEADFNAWTPDGKYDAVIANYILHHVVNLEGLFSAIGGALRDDGVFLSTDVIGRNGIRRWPETLAHVNRYWDRLPDSYKYDHVFQRTFHTYPDFDYSSSFLPGVTPSFECIRSQDILPLLVDRFDFELFLAHGGILDLFIDRCWGPNFSADRPEDVAFVDEVTEVQDRLLQSGEIKPTQMVAVMRKTWPHPPRVWGNLTPEFSVRDPDRSD